MTETATNIQEELEAWREVHQHLSHAVLAAREGVAAAKAQRRFWLEEIAGNLTPEGKLVASSVWKRPALAKTTRKAPKKASVKTDKGKAKKTKAPSKRKKKVAADDDEDDAEDNHPKKKTKLRLSIKKSKIKNEEMDEEMDEDSDDDVESPVASQEDTTHNYPGWSSAEQSLMHPPAAPSPYGMQQSQSLSATEHFAMMQNVPAELLPFLAPQPTVEIPSAPTGMHASMGMPSYPNAYASFAQASSSEDEDDDDSEDDDSSMEGDL